jgi:hypothetical protein
MTPTATRIRPSRTIHLPNVEKSMTQKKSFTAENAETAEGSVFSAFSAFSAVRA